MDNEIKGEGNSLNYSLRMHDPRVGRFFAVDPLTEKFPWNSSYAFSENRVIDGIELEGAETEWFMMQARLGMYGETVQQVTNGMSKSVEKTVNGLIYVVQNPKAAAKGAGNLLLGVAVKGSGVPSVVTNQTLMNMDAKLGTSTHATTQAFEQSIAKSADKLLNGNLEDKTEVATDIATMYFGTKGTNVVTKGLASGISKISLLKRFSSGATKLMSTEMLNKYPNSSTFGPPSTFVAPTAEIDALLSKGLPRGEIMEKLGIQDPLFLEGDLVRIDVAASELNNLGIKATTGAESGANGAFVKGGKTSGGVSEATITIPKKAKGVSSKTVKKK